MGLFDKKYCDFCGKKIGLLGNRRLEDGNMCGECAKKLSPFFSERRHSTKADIQEQLDYREANRERVAGFNTTRSIGNFWKILVDEDKKQFMVTNAVDLEKANPDVLDYSQATGCDLNIKETRIERKTKDSKGNYVSYNPPRYEYSYDFRVSISVDHPYFDEISYSLSNGPVNVGDRPPRTASGAWKMRGSIFNGFGANDYYTYCEMGEEIQELFNSMQLGDQESEQVCARMAVICPRCGATTIPDTHGCCEYCGGAVN